MKTNDNLAAAFAGESQARNRYTIFAQVAAKEGLQQISEIFTELLDFYETKESIKELNLNLNK